MPETPHLELLPQMPIRHTFCSSSRCNRGTASSASVDSRHPCGDIRQCMGGIWAADPYPNIDVGFQIPGVEGSGDPLRIPTVGMWSKLLLNRGAPDGSRRGAVRAPDNRSRLESGYETYERGVRVLPKTSRHRKKLIYNERSTLND